MFNCEQKRYGDRNMASQIIHNSIIRLHSFPGKNKEPSKIHLSGSLRGGIY